MSDHEFAAYLRKHGAINNYVIFRNSPVIHWHDGYGHLVAATVYDNEKGTREIFTFV
jgi:hypothetical protein